MDFAILILKNILILRALLPFQPNLRDIMQTKDNNFFSVLLILETLITSFFRPIFLLNTSFTNFKSLLI
jgi:hypothetical protein